MTRVWLAASAVALALAASLGTAAPPDTAAPPGTLPPGTLLPGTALPATALPEAAFSVTDDAGRTLRFERPATRLVTLAPSLTELVFAAGGGATIVGTDTSSDFPPEARALPRIGDAGRLDVERILALRPDLVVVWRHGNTARELEQLETAGLRLFRLEPQRLDDVVQAIERLGGVLGSQAVAGPEAARMREVLTAQRRRHAGDPPVRVFYQVWSSPLMTINRSQIVSEVIELCGGRNVFAGLAPLVPQVGTESVLAADPEAILSADERGGTALIRRDVEAAPFAVWRRYPRLAALRGGWMYVLNGDAISRQGPRIVGGVAAVCAALDEVRRERAARPR
ncbi:MAG: cobalamin-binding protein [Caldimonas sp.]